MLANICCENLLELFIRMILSFSSRNHGLLSTMRGSESQGIMIEILSKRRSRIRIRSPSSTQQDHLAFTTQQLGALSRCSFVSSKRTPALYLPPPAIHRTHSPLKTSFPTTKFSQADRRWPWPWLSPIRRYVHYMYLGKVGLEKFM